MCGSPTCIHFYKEISDPDIIGIYQARKSALDYLGVAKCTLAVMFKELSKHVKDLTEKDRTWSGLEHKWLGEYGKEALRQEMQSTIMSCLPSANWKPSIDQAMQTVYGSFFMNP